MASSLSVATGRLSWLRVLTGVGRGTRLPWLPLSVLVVLLVCSVFAPLLAPHDPTEISMLDARLAPLEDLTYLLGTDIMGRDMLSRLIYGARTGVFISLVARYGHAGGDYIGTGSSGRDGRTC